MNKLIFSCLLSLLCHHNLIAGWHERKAEGWAWYEDCQPPKEEKPPTAANELQAIQQNIEEKLAKAVLDPTPDNIKSYIGSSTKTA
jgi:conjugal transfer pilus assembly protein TraF